MVVYFFLERAGELRIFILRRNGGSKIDHYKLPEGWFYTAISNCMQFHLMLLEFSKIKFALCIVA
jgi:hypothetical protein